MTKLLKTRQQPSGFNMIKYFLSQCPSTWPNACWFRYDDGLSYENYMQNKQMIVVWDALNAMLSKNVFI